MKTNETKNQNIELSYMKPDFEVLTLSARANVLTDSSPYEPIYD